MVLKLGYNSNGFSSHGLKEGISMLADYGYSAVAITPDVGHLDPRYSTPGDVRAIGTFCRDLGMDVVLESGARFALDPRRKHRPNLLEVDEGRDIRLKYLRHLVEWCDLLGAKVLSFWSGVVPQGQTTEGAAGRLAEACENLGNLATRYGAKIALEPEPDHFIDTAESWKKFCGKFSPPVALALDVGHCLATGEGEPEKVLTKYATDVVSLQLDDMVRGDHCHLAPGEGDLDWPALSATTQSLNLTIPACWELSRDSHRFDTLAPEVAAFSRKVGLI
ncbi:MAG TPA: hypothetical protein DDW23_04530 [Planctomycetes bacterium]|nr:hypothetical protein [Planctomycetota bacterium]